MPEYHYADSVWDQVGRTGRCRFDVEGLHAVLADVQQRYQGEQRYFVTGWSAGGHLTWALVFREPERLRAAALSGANFNGRCLTNEVPVPFPVSRASERPGLPIKLLEGSEDPALTSPQPEKAMSLATANGYTNVTRDTIAGMPHSPMPARVLAFFATLWSRNTAPFSAY
jgi:dienelactone hydrolase